jgi:outer membrane lipoprotein
MKTITLFFFFVLLSSCASQPPAPISKIPGVHITVGEVRAEPERFIGSEVRWGGTIVKVENKAAVTWVEVVSRELKDTGRPGGHGESSGRFIASFPGFADPLVFQTGYLLTVVGTIEGQATQPIGEYDYRFPIVKVTGSYLWRAEPEPVPYEHPWPWWYDDPWPFYPGPYYPYLW